MYAGTPTCLRTPRKSSRPCALRQAALQGGQTPGPRRSTVSRKAVLATHLYFLFSSFYYSILMLLNCGVGEDSLSVPWTSRRSNQSILKISPGISLEGMMLKLKLQYFGHLMRRVDSLEKTLMLGGMGGRRRRGRRRMTWLDGITESMDLSLSELRQMLMNRAAWRAAIHGVAKSRTRLSD